MITRKKELSFIFFSSVFSFLMIIINYTNLMDGYGLIILFPIFYIITYFIFFLKRTSFNIVRYGILGMQFIRFIIMPVFIALSGSDAGLPFIYTSVESLNVACLLMIGELIISSFVYYIFNLIFGQVTKYNKEYSLIGNQLVYYVFFVFTIIIYFLFGRNKNLLSFLIIRTGTGERLGDVTNFTDLVVRQVLICSFFLFFCIIVYYSYKKYNETKSGKYYYYSLLSAILNISFIVGERRSNQVYVAFCTIYILLKLFPDFRKKTLVIILSFTSIILIIMSIYKFFYAFLYDSYIEAVKQSTINSSFISQTLQSYFFGPQNIATTIDFFNATQLDIFQPFFDFIRSIFGINFILKNSQPVTSVYFNTFIYGGYRETGQVLSSVGYSYGFFGAFFLYIQSAVNILIAMLVEKKMYTTKYIEILYVLLYVLIRFTTNLFVNTAPLVSQATLFSFSSLLVIFIAKLFNFKKVDG